MSWAASRTTTRVEDRAYSLMGLLDVNMPMLYGEGKKAFHRLQLEIIRTSNDQSIFAWGCNSIVRTGSILADDPSFFRGCDEMELMDRDEFIESLQDRIPEEELLSIEDGRFGTFFITNGGIQIWLFLCPRVGSGSLFQALLPCRFHPSGLPVVIDLALWESNYYRHTGSLLYEGGRLQLCQVYLRYQGTQHCNSTFEIDDSAILKDGFTYSTSYPEGLNTGNMVILSTTDPLCVNVYSLRQGYHIAVGFGRCFGQNWIHVEPASPLDSLCSSYGPMLERAPEHAQSMNKARSGAAHCQVYMLQSPLPRSTWILQTSFVMWKSSGMCGVKLELFLDFSFGHVSGKWTGFDIDVSIFLCARTLPFHWSPSMQGADDPDRDWRGLMIRHCPSIKQYNCELLVDGVPMKFSYVPNDIKVSTHTFHNCSRSLTRTAGGLWLLYGLRRILLRREPLC